MLPFTKLDLFIPTILVFAGLEILAPRVGNLPWVPPNGGLQLSPCHFGFPMPVNKTKTKQKQINTQKGKQ